MAWRLKIDAPRRAWSRKSRKDLLASAMTPRKTRSAACKGRVDMAMHAASRIEIEWSSLRFFSSSHMCTEIVVRSSPENAPSRKTGVRARAGFCTALCATRPREHGHGAPPPPASGPPYAEAPYMPRARRTRVVPATKRRFGRKEDDLKT